MINNKIVKFNNSDETYFSLATKRREQGNVIGAISTLLNLEERGCRMLELYAEIGSIYSDLQLYSSSAHYWFKYLAHNTKSHQARAYNALGAAFYLSGNIAVSSYYFERQLAADNVSEQDYDDVMYDYYDSICDLTKPEFYVCYPENKRSADKIIIDGDKFFAKKKYKEALEEFSKVEKTDENYVEAQIKCGGSLLCMQQTDEAVEIFKKLCEDYPNSPEVVLNTINVLHLVGRKNEAMQYLELADQLELVDADQCYKLAGAYCDFKNTLKAREYLIKAEQFDPNNINVIFLLGLVLFNSAELTRAKDCFSRCYLVSRSPIPQYYLNLCYEVEKNPKKFKTLEYVYNLQRDVAEKWVEEIGKIIRGGAKAVQKASKARLIELAKWLVAIDSKLAAPYFDILMSTSSVAIRKYATDELLNPSFDDSLKSIVIEKLVERGYDKKIGVTFGLIFVNLQLYRAEFEDEKNQLFTSAYSYAFGKIAPFEPENAIKIRDGAYKLYYKLKENGNLRHVSDRNALAAVIVTLSGVKTGNKKGLLADYLSADKKKIKEIVALSEEVK